MDSVLEIQICDAYAKGAPVSEIANEFGFSKITIYKTLKKFGATLRPLTERGSGNSRLDMWDDETTDQFIRDYSDGILKVNQILEKYDIGAPTLYTLLTILNIPSRKMSATLLEARDRRMDQAVKLYQEGHQIWTIEEETHICSTMLYRELYHRGVRLRNKR